MRSSEKMGPIIALLSDLGSIDPYVAEIKAVILSISPDVTIVDVTHEVKRFDVRMGAFILASATPFFPGGAIFVCVVDPGVGTKRRILLVKTKEHYLVGPDNGLLMLAALEEGIEAVVSVENESYMLTPISPTFHGRDIMAPVAAHLAKGTRMEEFGPLITDYQKPSFAEPREIVDGIVGQILHVDNFGNIITNITGRSLKRFAEEGGTLCISLGRRSLTLRMSRTYADAPDGSPLALIGSSGYLEVAVNRGNAAELLGVKVGDPAKIQVLKLH